jgi:hypothetical protein
MTEPMYRQPVVAELAGVSYKQLDYWVRCDWLHPTNNNLGRHGSAPGSGYSRLWPASEVDVARIMGLLVRAGLAVHVAGDVARVCVERGDERVELAGGVVLILPPPAPLDESIPHEQAGAGVGHG